MKDMIDSLYDRPRIIIYDDKNIHYLSGICGQCETKSEPINVTSISDNFSTYIPPMTSIFTAEILNSNTHETIELDDTTMRRIAKFNKEQEIKRLDEIIKDKKEKIKELDDIITDKDKRIKKLKDFVADLYDIDINDDYDDDDYWD